VKKVEWAGWGVGYLAFWGLRGGLGVWAVGGGSVGCVLVLWVFWGASVCWVFLS